MVRAMVLPILLLAALGGAPDASPGRVGDSVVKVYTTRQLPSFGDPWAAGTVDSLTGSGCAIAGRRILTSAHVVSDRTFVAVRRSGDAEKYEARVVHASHEADLALLAVDDEAFWAGLGELPLGPLPPLQGEVLVHGFPSGGDTMSVTRGVVSRVEHQLYLHATRELLAGQIDAAINPGNSGGPVTRDGRLVGIVMQNDLDADNVGYMVAVSVIQHFLADVADGRLDGIPALGIDWQPVENRDLRELYGLSPGRTGVLVTRVVPGSTAEGALRRGDVLTALGDLPVGGDGTVEFRARERTSLSYGVERLQVGEPVHLELLRDGRTIPLDLPLKAGGWNTSVVAAGDYDRPPTYFVFGGLVFCPLTLSYLESWGEEWSIDAPANLLAELERAPSVAGEEVVVLVRVLASAISEGYHDLADEVVSSVDGVRPRNFAHFVQLVEQGDSRFLRLSYRADSRELVLRRDKARAASPGILARYGIPADRSPELRADGAAEAARAASPPRD
jgi:S1-C subfamily serine protease